MPSLTGVRSRQLCRRQVKTGFVTLKNQFGTVPGLAGVRSRQLCIPCRRKVKTGFVTLKNQFGKICLNVFSEHVLMLFNIELGGLT
jgi:hypothetical protein